jgi:hypothetical protein
MEYLPLFLLFMAVLIAAWFYLKRATVRDAGTTTVDTGVAAAPTPMATAAPTEPTPATAAPSDRPE